MFWNLLIICTVVFGGYYLLKWIFFDDDEPTTYTYIPPTHTPPYKPYTPPTYTPPPESTSRPSSFKFWGKKISDYLVDPNTKIATIFVEPIAADELIHGNMSYSESLTEKQSVRLVRSGTGFRVFNHPNIQDGKWLSCR